MGLSYIYTAFEFVRQLQRRFSAERRRVIVALDFPVACPTVVQYPQLCSKCIIKQPANRDFLASASLSCWPLMVICVTWLPGCKPDLPNRNTLLSGSITKLIPPCASRNTVCTENGGASSTRALSTLPDLLLCFVGPKNPGEKRGCQAPLSVIAEVLMVNEKMVGEIVRW